MLHSDLAPMHRVIRIGLCITCGWFLAENLVEAQQSSAATAQPSPTKSEPTPIPLSEFASKGHSAAESLRDIEASLSNDQTIATIEKRLPQLANEIELRTAQMAKLLAASMPLQVLHYMELDMQTFRDELSTWNHELTEHTKTLDDQIAQLDRLSKVWKSSLRLPELSRTAPEIVKRVQSLIDSISRTQQTAESLRERGLSLQGRVLEATAQLETTAAAIEQAQASAVRNLFVRDSPPIWSVWVQTWKEESRAPFIRRTAVSVFAAYIRHRPTVFLLHAIIVLLLLFVVYWFRGEIHKRIKEEPSLPPATPVFDLPVATAIMLSFLITGPIYSTAPLFLQAILGGALLILTVLILHRVVDRALFPIINALLVFYFLDQLRLITAPLPLWRRTIFSAEMLSATLFLIWLIRSNHLPTVSASTTKLFARVIRSAIQIGLVVFPAALLANVFGYLNLANLLADGALRSAYFAAVLYAVVRIVEELIVISLGTRPLASVRVVRLNRPMLQRRLVGAAKFLAFVYWLSLTLDFFAVRAPFIKGIEAVLRANLTIGSLSISLGQILIFLATVWVSFLASSFLRFLLEEDIYHHWRLARGIPQAISTIVHYAILLLGFFVALAALGVDLTKVTILAGAFTVGVGFGLQTVINNFVCGLILLFERPIKVGDLVQIDTDVGEVRRIGVRACVIRTADGADVIVPNGTIISNKVTNWTLSDRCRAVEVSVKVARGVASKRVVELLKNVAANHPGIIKEPPPQAYPVDFAPGAVSFKLRAWTDRYEDWIQVCYDLAAAIDDALTRENITIA
jgi:potassium-dependent mechanosensitive channel